MYMLHCLFFRNLVDVHVGVHDVHALLLNVHVAGETLTNLFPPKSTTLLPYEFCNCKRSNLFTI